jgi:hypothetical protein
MMLGHEMQVIENAIISYGSQCPYAPNEPSCQSDYDWQDAYFKFCSERLERLTLEDWIFVASNPDFELLKEYLSEFVGRFNLSTLSETDIVILLSAAPELADKCNLAELTASSWENLIENCGYVFADAKYGIYLEWKKVNVNEALNRWRIMGGE